MQQTFGILIIPGSGAKTPASSTVPRSTRVRPETGLEVVSHPLVEVQLHGNAESVEALIEADKAAEQRLLEAALNEGRWEPFGKVGIHRRRVRMFLILWVGPRAGSLSFLFLVA